MANGFAQILDEAGHVDVLVNNAGVGGNAVVEECSTAMYLDVMNVNLCGAIRCAAAVLPGMRERRSGTIVNITSVVGKFGSVGQAPYVASKWAFEGVSEELAHEVAPFGIRVVIVEPGITKSAIFAKNVDAPNSTGAYDTQYRRLFQFYAKGLVDATPADEVAAVIHEAITTDEPRAALPGQLGERGDRAPAGPRCPTRSGSRSARSTTMPSTSPSSSATSASTSADHTLSSGGAAGRRTRRAGRRCG